MRGAWFVTRPMGAASSAQQILIVQMGSLVRQILAVETVVRMWTTVRVMKSVMIPHRGNVLIASAMTNVNQVRPVPMGPAFRRLAIGKKG